MKPSLQNRLFSAVLLELSSGHYPEGARFLSLRQIVNRFGASKPTVNQVQARLLKEGLLVTRPRSGTFVAAGARERAMLLLEQTPLSTIPTPRTWSTRRGHLLRQARITQARRIAIIYHQTNSQAGDKTPFEEAIPPSVRCSQGCAEAARERGADIGFALHDGTEKRHQSVLQWLKTTHPGGVLIIQRSDSFRQFHEIVDPMLARGTPVVNLFGDVQGADLINIDFNNVAGGFQAVTDLIGRGCGKILVITSPKSSMLSSTLRVEGARLAARQADVPLEVLDASFDGVTVRPPSLPDDDGIPVGILAVSHDYGIAVLRKVRQEGRPRVLGSYTFSSLQETPWGEPMPIVQMDFNGIGAAAVHSLLDVMEGEEVHRTVLFPMALCRQA